MWLMIDLLIAAPAAAFLVYVIIVLACDGKDVNSDAYKKLKDVAKWGPTIFPIVFAAIVANFLKNLAAWKLERGISLLSLELLLSSRTVFSAVSTPFFLRTFNLMMPLLLALWALSPLGGQATLRVLDTSPSKDYSPWSAYYLDYRSNMTIVGVSSAGTLLPTIMGVFTSALSSSPEAKNASQDTFGNIKIPMIESYIGSDSNPDYDGWYKVHDRKNVTYSSLSGLPMTTPEKRDSKLDYSFILETSYMYTNCTVEKRNNTDFHQWMNTTMEDAKNTTLKTGQAAFSNGKTLLLQTNFSSKPSRLQLDSYTDGSVSHIACNLTMSYLNADVSCKGTDCSVVRVQPVEKPQNETQTTVLEGMNQHGQLEYTPLQNYFFFSYFVPSTDNPFSGMEGSKWYSSPLEYYFNNPDYPYAATYANLSDTGPIWRGADIWRAGDHLVSERLSQLMNTFWIANIAPVAATGGYTYRKQGNEGAGNMNPNYYIYQQTNGTSVSNVPVLESNKAWVAILFIAASVMLVAGITTAVMHARSRGPDILDRTSLLMRNNLNAKVEHYGSMEDGFEAVRRMQNTKVCLGDTRPDHDIGHLAIGTVDEVKPLRSQEHGRLYD